MTQQAARNFHPCDDESHEDCWSCYEIVGNEHRYLVEHTTFYEVFELMYGYPYEAPGTVESQGR